MTARSSTRECKIRAVLRSRTSSAAAACHGGRNPEVMKTNNSLVRRESIFLSYASSAHQRICILKAGRIKTKRDKDRRVEERAEDPNAYPQLKELDYQESIIYQI